MFIRVIEIFHVILELLLRLFEITFEIVEEFLKQYKVSEVWFVWS